MSSLPIDVPPLVARLKPGETIGDRVMKVDHAGEHGAICIYRAQIALARWTAPAMVAELRDFLAHECRHRALFAAELAVRGQGRCRSYALCGLGGFTLGTITGLLGAGAIAATTAAIEQVVVRHMQDQIAALDAIDPAAVAALRSVIDEERDHLASAAAGPAGIWRRVIAPVVSASTEAIIWLGMRL